MKVNSVNDIQNYKQNFGIRISKRAEKNIAQLVKDGVISANPELLQKIRDIPGNFTLTSFAIKKAGAQYYNAYYDIPVRRIYAGYNRLHTKGGIYIPSQTIVSTLSHINNWEVVSADKVVEGIKENMGIMCRLYMDSQAHKGKLKRQLRQLQKEFAGHDIPAYFKEYQETDALHAQIRANFKANHPVLAKLFSIK